MRSTVWRLALACALILGTSAQARPFTVDDLLHLSVLGRAEEDPTGRWLLIEHQGPYAAGARFDNNVDSRPLHTHLLRVDLAHPGMARAAFSQRARAGYLAGPFSPDGRAVLVFKAERRSWEMGILDIGLRRVRWFGLGSELADLGDTVVWKDTHTVLALVSSPTVRPYRLRLNQAAMDALPGLWARARIGAGQTAVTYGSGRYRDIHVADPQRRLVSIDVSNGKMALLAQGVFESLALSTDHTEVAIVEAHARAEQPTGLLAVGDPWQIRRLRILDIKSGAISEPCAGRDIARGSLRWSDTADDLLMLARSDPDAWDQARFFRRDKGGDCQALPMQGVTAAIDLPGSAFSPPHAEWLAGAPVIFGSRGGARSDWYRLAPSGAVNLTAALDEPGSALAALSPDSALFLDRGKPYQVDLNGHAVRLGATTLNRVITAPRLNMSVPAPADNAQRGVSALAISVTGDGQSLWRIEHDAIVPLAHTPDPGVRVLTGGVKGLIGVAIDPHGVQTVALWRLDGSRVPLLTVNAQLSAIDFAIPIQIAHVGPHGEALKSWLYRPKSAPDHTLPPLLVMAYPSSIYPDPPFGGRPGALDLIDDNIQLAVAQGFAVLAPSLPTDPQSRDPGLGWAARILPIIDQVGHAGLADTSRLAYWGHSYGGYVGLMLAAETSRFRAIIASAAPTDLTSVRSEAWPAAWLSPELALAVQAMTGWSERGVQGHLLTTPWEDPAQYERNSPVLQVKNIHTPILLAQGDQDFISIEQGREMFSDLNRLNKDTLFVTYYGENHTIASPGNIRAYARTAYRFLRDNLRSATAHP